MLNARKDTGEMTVPLPEANQELFPIPLGSQWRAESKVTRIIGWDIGTNDFLHFARVEKLLPALVVVVNSQGHPAEERHVLSFHSVPFSPAGEEGRTDWGERVFEAVGRNAGIICQVDRLDMVVENHFRVQLEEEETILLENGTERERWDENNM